MASNLQSAPEIPDHTLFTRVGKGAYGEVWLARNIMGAWRAVKIIRRASFGSNRPFEREFEGIKKFEPVSHANDSQLDILHVGENQQEGYFYYVMELADDRQCGREIEPEKYQPRTLQSDLQEHRRLAANDCLQVGITLCKALEHLHAHGLIHRDIKPSNIIFLHSCPMLADIGLVANIDQTMSFVGTEGFVPPEGPGTVRADLYSLGKVLYELHTGFDRSQFPELPTMLEAAEDPTLARELNLAIIKACAPEQGKRHANAAELREELELLLKGKSIQRLRNAENRAVVFRRISIAAGIVAIVALIAYLAALRANRRADENARIAQNELWKSRLAEARAGRLSREIGSKEKGVEAIAAAARIRPSLELRNEAIAYAALYDFSPSLSNHTFNTQKEIVAINPEITQVATVQLDGCIRMESIDGKILREWKEELPAPVHSVTFARHGKSLVLQAHGHPVRLLDLETTNRVNLGPGESFAGYSPDEKFYGVIQGGAVSIRSFQNDAEVSVVKVNEPITGAVFASDSENLVLMFINRLEVWNWRNPIRLREIIPPGAFDVATYSSNYCAFGDATGAISLVTTKTGEVRKWQAHQTVVSYLKFIRDEPLLISGSHDGVINQWRIDSGHLESVGKRERPADFSPDGSRVQYRSYNSWSWGKISKRQGYRTVELSSFSPTASWHLDFSPDGKWVAARSRVGLAILNAEKWQVVTWIPMEILCAEFLSTNSLLTISREKVEVWPLRSFGGQLQLRQPIEVKIPPFEFLENAFVTDDGRYLAVAAGENGLALIDFKTKQTKTFSGAFRARSPVVTRDGKFLITGTFHGHGPFVWDAAKGEVSKQLEADNSNVYLNPDNTVLLVAGTLHYRLYQVGTWRLLKEIPSESGHDLPNTAAWSLDGKYLAIVKQRNQVQLLNGRTWEQLAALISPDPLNIVDVEFASGGSILLTSSDQGRIEVWDLSSFNHNLQSLGLHWTEPKPLSAIPKAPHLLETSVLSSTSSTNSDWPARDSSAPGEALDLTPWYNARLDEAWSDSETSDNSLASLPTGMQDFTGIRFDVRGLIQLASRGLITGKKYYPAEIKNIRVSQAVRRIHFLCASVGNRDPCGKTLAEISFKTTGSHNLIWPLRACDDLVDWWGKAGDAHTAHLETVWIGQNPKAESLRCKLRLFRLTWENPYPREKIESIDLSSNLALGGLFIIAITTEH